MHPVLKLPRDATANRRRPRNTAETDGYLVYKQGGRLNKAKNDRETSGKPTGEGSGCRVGKSSGRPTGTTKMNGYGVGLSGGVYASSQSNVLFKDDVELPDEWDTSSETVNVDGCLLCRCASRIVQQRAFDSQPLAIGLCYSCGRVLWNPSHAHYSGLVTLPSGMTPDYAPPQLI